MIRALLISLLMSYSALAQFTIPARTGATAASGGGGVTITYVQGGTPATSTAHTVSCATAGSVASGDLVLLLSKYQSVTTTGVTMAGSSASGPTITWTPLTSIFNAASGSTYWAAAAWGIAGTSGTETATATWTGGTDGGFLDCTIAVMHSTSGWQTTPLDVKVSAVGTLPTTSCTPGTTATTTSANELVVAACFNFNAGQTYGAVSPYTFQSASSRNTTAFYWKQVSSVGTQTIAIPLTSDVWVGAILTFKAN